MLPQNLGAQLGAATAAVLGFCLVLQGRVDEMTVAAAGKAPAQHCRDMPKGWWPLRHLHLVGMVCSPLLNDVLPGGPDQNSVDTQPQRPEGPPKQRAQCGKRPGPGRCERRSSELQCSQHGAGSCFGSLRQNKCENVGRKAVLEERKVERHRGGKPQLDRSGAAQRPGRSAAVPPLPIGQCSDPHGGPQRTLDGEQACCRARGRTFCLPGLQPIPRALQRL